MQGDYGNMFALGGLGVFSILVIVLLICSVIAYFLAIAYLVKNARLKNAPQSSGALWFIGLFTTPVVLGLIVASMPDRGQAAGGHYASNS